MKKRMFLKHARFNQELDRMEPLDYAFNLSGLRIDADGDKVAERALVRRGFEIVDSLNPNLGLEVLTGLADFELESQDECLVASLFNKAAAIVPSCHNGGTRTSYFLENLLIAVAGQAGWSAQSLVTKQFMISAQGGSKRRRTMAVFGSTPENTHVFTGCFKGNLPEFEEAVWRKHIPGSPERKHYNTVLKVISDVVNGSFCPPDLIKELQTGGPNPVARGAIKWETLAR